MTKFSIDNLKSSLERSVYKILKSFKNSCKFKISYETEELPYVINRKYVPDFIIEFKDGYKIYIEAKGYLRPDDRAKLLAVKTQHPDKDIRIVFERNNRLNKKAKSTYADWATRHGWTYSIGSIPREWFSNDKNI